MSRFIVRGQHTALGERTLSGSTFDVRATRPGEPWEYFYAILDEPLSYRLKAGGQMRVDDIVFRSATPGQMPYFGMRGFRVELGLVLDRALRDDPLLDLRRVEFVGHAELDDADNAPRPHENTAPPSTVQTNLAPAADEAVTSMDDTSPAGDDTSDGVGANRTGLLMRRESNPHNPHRRAPDTKPADDVTSGDDTSLPSGQSGATPVPEPVVEGSAAQGPAGDGESAHPEDAEPSTSGVTTGDEGGATRVASPGRRATPHMLFGSPAADNAHTDTGVDTEDRRGAEPAGTIGDGQAGELHAVCDVEPDSAEPGPEDASSAPPGQPPRDTADQAPLTSGDDMSPEGSQLSAGGSRVPLERATRVITGPTTSRDRPSDPSSHFNEPRTADHADRTPLTSRDDTSPADLRRTVAQRAPEEMTAIIPVIPERSPDEFTAIFDPKPRDHDEMTSIIQPASLAPAPSPMSTAALSRWDIVTRKPQPSRKKIAILSGSAAALLIVIALAVWFLNDDATPSAPPAASPTTTSAAATTPSSSKPAPPPPPPPAIGIDAVLPLLPPGYPPGACTPDAHPLAGVTAAAACGPNTEPAGPIAAQYSVFPQGPSLKAAFDQVTATATAVGCPGGMQSPVLCPTGVSKTVWGMVSAMMRAMPVR